MGFAGAPWTVATYMVAGQGSREQSEARRLAYSGCRRFRSDHRPDRGVTLDYLSGQIEAGAEAVQLFDSWAGSLAPAEFDRCDCADQAHSGRAEIETPRGPGDWVSQGRGRQACGHAEETGVDAIGLDETVDPSWASREFPKRLPVQGNLDPLALLTGGLGLGSAVASIP